MKIIHLVILIGIVTHSSLCMAYEGEFDKYVGKKYWIIDPTHTTFYRDCTVGSLEIISIKEGVAFTIKRIVGNRVDLNFDDGSNACLLERYVDFNPYYFSESDFTILDREVYSTLDKLGMTKNTPIWLKHPFMEMRGLTKVKLGNVRVFNGNVYMAINDNSHIFDNIFEVMDTFYIGSLPKDVKKWNKKVLRAIADHKAFIGMSRDQVKASVGKPKEINRTVGRWGTQEQWVYGDSPSSYLYLDNGVLTSFQD